MLQMQYLLASQGSQASGVETAKLVGMVKFLGALGCSAEDDPEGACGALAREVQALSAQINAGQNFYGRAAQLFRYCVWGLTVLCWQCCAGYGSLTAPHGFACRQAQGLGPRGQYQGHRHVCLQ